MQQTAVVEHCDISLDQKFFVSRLIAKLTKEETYKKMPADKSAEEFPDIHDGLDFV
jgi:hypothetical protein